MNKKALVLAGHGSHESPEPSKPVFDHADSIRKKSIFNEVRETFWKEEPYINEIIRTVRSNQIYIVPLFMSDGYFAGNILPRELKLSENHRVNPDKKIYYTDPVGTHSDITNIVIKKAKEKIKQTKKVGLAVIGHGTEKNSNSSDSVYKHIEKIRKKGEFDSVKPFFIEERPYVDNITEFFNKEKIVVVPLFISNGPHTKIDIPNKIGIDDSKQKVDGHTVIYTDPVGTDEKITDIILKRVKSQDAETDTQTLNSKNETDPNTVTESKTNTSKDKITLEKTKKSSYDKIKNFESKIDFLTKKVKDKNKINFKNFKVYKDNSGFTVSTPIGEEKRLNKEQLYELSRKYRFFISNWYHWKVKIEKKSREEKKFLEWIEKREKLDVLGRYKREKIDRFWGELAIITKINENGNRKYRVSHMGNLEDSKSQLKVYKKPLKARYIAKFDEDNTYRPLKTERSLKKGWVFTDLNAEKLIKVIDFIYPASIENWYLENTDSLDVKNYSKAVKRQTGIYKDIDKIDSSKLESITKELCSKRCVKKRIWEEKKDEKINTKRTESNIPCREPCSIFLEMTRKNLRDGQKIKKQKSSPENSLKVISIVNT